MTSSSAWGDNSPNSGNGIPGTFEGQHEDDEEFQDARDDGAALPALSTQRHMNQLDMIDKLQDLDIAHENIDLPRLLVCGDQSAGKSSVLGALTRIPFPRQTDTCTRFVTQITLRHDAKNSSRKVSIIPHTDRKDDDPITVALKNFKHDIRIDFSNLPDIIKAAGNLIFTRESKEFSEDILKIEISGKEQQPLEILDLPGLINNDRSLGKDELAAKNIVKQHIQQKRSIILVVIGADIDLRRHSILQIIAQMPECRDRAFGVITKPDRTETLETYLGLATNKIEGYEFEWGWHVLRNSTKDELEKNYSWDQRDLIERNFFETDEGWKRLLQRKPYDSPEQIVGIAALRGKVRQLLFELGQKELPRIRIELQKKLKVHQARLRELGGERNPAQTKERLRQGCARLAHLAQDYSRGVYDPRLKLGSIENKDLLLRSRVRDLSDEFTWSMHTFGHTFSSDHFPLIPNSHVGILDLKSKSTNDAGMKSRTPLFKPPKKLTQKQCTATAREFLKATRGEELPTYYDPARISHLFQHQSTKWEEIARHYLEEFYDRCEVFLQCALEREFGKDSDAPSRMWEAFLTDNVDKRKADAEMELRKLFSDRMQPVMTHSLEFLVAVTEAQTKRRPGAHRGSSAPLPNGTSAHADSSNDEAEDGPKHETEIDDPSADQNQDVEASRFSDDMLRYYVHARTMFVDNFLMQVVERHLVHEMFKLFDNVHNLSLEEAEEILREREDHRVERDELALKIQRLKEATKILS